MAAIHVLNEGRNHDPTHGEGSNYFFLFMSSVTHQTILVPTGCWISSQKKWISDKETSALQFCPKNRKVEKDVSNKKEREERRISDVATHDDDYLSLETSSNEC